MPTTVALPDDYVVLPHEDAGFDRQNTVNAGVVVVLDAEVPAFVRRESVLDVVRGYVAVHAAEQMAGYPQYHGHFASPRWRLARFDRHVITKGGLRFAAGDYAIVRVEASPLPLVDAARHLAWSIRGSVEVVVAPGDYSFVD